MYKNELDKHIKNNSLANSFILFGESSFLIDSYINKLSQKEDASVLKLYFDEYDFSSAKAHLSQASLFGDQNILIIKSEKKIPKKELETLIEQCEKNKDNLFIFGYYGDDYNIYKNGVGKYATMSVRFFHPNHSEAIHIVQDAAKKQELQIDGYSINHLLNIHNNNVALACNELEKLKIYNKNITTKDIDHLIFGLSEVTLGDFVKKVLTKKDFKSDLLNLLEHSQDEIAISNAIISYVSELYLFHIYIRVNGAPNAIEILGYNPPKNIVDEKAALSIKFKPNTYAKLLELLLESDLKMKTSFADKNAILLSTLIRVQQLL
ncbi:MAG: polymerase subunit delta [Campylobacterota bacterium]|nr:polymerase subunit delta [Campylobacterota bacterium]